MLHLSWGRHKAQPCPDSLSNKLTDKSPKNILGENKTPAQEAGKKKGISRDNSGFNLRCKTSKGVDLHYSFIFDVSLNTL
jgi:hypothetical protein